MKASSFVLVVENRHGCTECGGLFFRVEEDSTGDIFLDQETATVCFNVAEAINDNGSDTSECSGLADAIAHTLESRHPGFVVTLEV